MPYFHWQQLTTSDQLRNPANSFLFKDSKGFLWIGSTSGLQRYDGYEIKDYGTLTVGSSAILGKNIQGQIVEDKNHDLWVTTYQSLNHYDVGSEVFTSYSIKDTTETVISGFHSCGNTDNIIWLLHQDSLRQFDVLTRKFIASFNIETKDLNRGMVRKFGKTTLVYAYALGGEFVKIYDFVDGNLNCTREVFLKEQSISSIFPINENVLLVGGNDNLQEIIIGSSKKDKPILWQKKALKSVVGISAFSKNEILLATDSGDLFRYNLSIKKVVKKLNFEKLKESNPDNKLLTVLVDDQQNIWVSSRSDGIYFTHPDKVKFVNLASEGVVTNLIQRKNGEIWVFTNKKILVLNESGEIIHVLESNLENCDNLMDYHLVNDEKGRLWTNYYYSLEKNDEKLTLEQYLNEGSYEFKEIRTKEYTNKGLTLEDGRTVFLNGRGKGLYTFVEKDQQFYQEQIPCTDEIIEPFNLYQNPQGQIIILKGNTKLSFYDPIDFSEIDNFDYNGSINDMLSIPHDSILWIGGADGLVSFNYETKKFFYHSKEGKLPNEVFGLLLDEAGNLWLSSDKGIYFFNPTTKKTVSYNQADGTGSTRFSRNAHIKLRDGRLAFGGDAGLLIFDPKDIKSKVPMAVPQITDILIDGKKRIDLKCENTGATNIEEIEKLRLNPKDNNLEFHFVAIEYSNTKENLINYRLSPEEIEWKTVESGGKCQYTNIDPGHYTFEIQAANSDGIWNEILKDQLEITVLPPFRKTIWFKLIIFLIITGVVSLIVTFIQKQKRRKEQAYFDKNLALEKQRLRIARDMHDDLGSRLSAISLKTAMLETKFQNPQWKKEMGKLTEDAQEISISIQETIWTVDARNDSLDKLIQYLLNYTEQLFDNLDTNHYFNIAEDLPEKQIVSGTIRRMVFLAYKEILNNIIKHAQAKKVMIGMKMEKDHFILTISDNGIGFDFHEKEKGRGNGLDNMRYRMEKIGGTCEFLPTKKGTTIQLNFNFLDQ